MDEFKVTLLQQQQREAMDKVKPQSTAESAALPDPLQDVSLSALEQRLLEIQRANRITDIRRWEPTITLRVLERMSNSDLRELHSKLEPKIWKKDTADTDDQKQDKAARQRIKELLK